LERKGKILYELAKEMYPVCRSITGDGVRKTLSMIAEKIPVEINEIPSGTKVFDWEIPLEWNIQDAWIKNSRGEKIIDFQKLNLHILNYSTPVHRKVNLSELKKHIFTLPEYPDWVPYRTSYYTKNWGFCMAHRQFEKLQEEVYEVMIDSTLKPGSLTFGEYLIRGKSSEEVLISTHICHPSLANDNLSGISIATFLAEELSKKELNYSYRLLFIPGTIGSITWLSLNEEKLNSIKYGLVLNLLGDSGKFNYKKSRMGNAEIDRIVEYTLKANFKDFGIMEFYPYGYDERQFCSPAFNLPVGRLSRAIHGEFPEYHTSADNLDFITPQNLEESYLLVQKVIDTIEKNKCYVNQNPKGEPNLGRRGLYKTIAGQADTKDFEMALLWILNLSDGTNSLIDIAERSNLQVDLLYKAAQELKKVNLLKEEPVKVQENN